MACIKSAPRSALVAFAPDAPYLAAGTMAGAVDLSFSSSANLEIFKLDFQSDAQELPVVGACPSSERFNRLSWGWPVSASEEYSLGLVAGGLCDGSIGVWNPLKLISSDKPDSALVARLEKHTGPVWGLEFSAHSPNMLASGSDEGELCIWDLADPTEPNLFPSLKSVGSSAQTEVSFVSWNPKFQHILGSTSYNGISVVWDLRQQKPVTSFSDSSRRRCSVLQWNPDMSTQLILSSDDDSSPSLRVWDVRKTISPLREFVGHTRGVIAMSWCPNDSGFLLTCAKDNRTICWDTGTGEVVCELPASNNWNFDIHWYPKIPGVISASSFDVKIAIYNIEACSRLILGEGEFGVPAKLRAPKWLKRPAGASFGFGGKLVSFHPSPSTLGASSCTSEVYVHNLVTEHSLVSRSIDFQAALQNGERTSLQALCDKKSQDSESEDDRKTWGFLKVMFEEEGTTRTKLLAHLGFSVPNEGGLNALDDLGKKLMSTLILNEQTTDKGGLMEGKEGSAFAIDHGEEFFNNPQPSGDSLVTEEANSSNGKQVLVAPEEHQESSDSSVDDNIQRALVVGDYKRAVLQCISANRMADALVIAHVGGPSLWESTRDQYLKKSHLPYLKIVAAMVSNDIMSLVNTRPLSLWKETLALLCTFAQRDEWTALCDSLARRLMTGGNTLAATLCYICAGNIDGTIEIWSRNLKAEQEGKTYVDLLHDLMEKTIVLVFAIGHKQFSASLSKLIESYAELLASQGLLATAMEYLKLLGSGESSQELAILRDRIVLSGEERETKCYPYESGAQQASSMYGAEQSGFKSVDSSQHYNKDKSLPQQQQSIPGSPYGQAYQQSFGSSYVGYQPMQQKQQFQEYINPVPFQPAQSPQMFLPSQAPQILKPSFAPPPVSTQPAVKPFVPAPPPTLRNVEQYQQPTLGAQLYSGVASPPYQSGPPGPGSSQAANFPGNKFAQVMAPNPAPRSFVPVTTPGFIPRHSVSPVQPSGPTQPSQVQAAVAPPAPPPTVQTVDTSNVSAELRTVVTTLTRLFNETSEALGGSRANPSKKREIEDNSRKIGSLFVKLNFRDISPNAASKLCQLCQALDSGDFVGALQIQVQLTTSDWEECNFWLGSVKRMIKTWQASRLK